METNHPADKLRKKSSEYSTLEERIEKIKDKRKEVKITYKKIAKNNLVAKKVKLLKGKKEGIFLADGTRSGEYEQLVFEVVMSGEITDDYAAFDTEDLQPGTRVIVNRWGEFIHEDNVKAESDKGEDITGYYIIEARNVMAIVNYEKI